jgi:hypothetical protein
MPDAKRPLDIGQLTKIVMAWLLYIKPSRLEVFVDATS